MAHNLSLVPVEELINEIDARHTDCIILATRDMDHRGEYIYHSIKVTNTLVGYGLLEYGNKKMKRYLKA